MRRLLVLFSFFLFCLAAPAKADSSALAGDWAGQFLDMPGYLCATDCGAGSCSRWCSFQQRCTTMCSPQGLAACYCTF